MSSLTSNRKSRAFSWQRYAPVYIAVPAVSLSILIAVLLGIAPERFIPFIAAAILLSGVAILNLFKPAILIHFIILTSALAGLLRDDIAVGVANTTLTISGLRWVFVAMAALALLGFNLQRVVVPKYLFLFILFAIWASVNWAINSFTGNGLKDVLVYMLPPLIGIYFLVIASGRQMPDLRQFENALLGSAVIPLGVYAVSIPLGFIRLTANGPQGIMGARSVAIYLLVVLALSLSMWRYGLRAEQKRRGIFISILVLGIIIFTFSRTSIAMALVLVLFRFSSPRSVWIVPASILGTVIAIFILAQTPALRDRFFHRPPENFSEAIQVFNTSGRNRMWPATFEHARQSPLLGHGPGNARLFVAATVFGGVRKNLPISELHPHNEYLQVLNDMGIIGVGLISMTWPILLIRYWKRWKATNKIDPETAKCNMAATLAVIIVIVTALVDNTFHFAHVTLPAIIITAIAEFNREDISDLRHG